MWGGPLFTEWFLSQNTNDFERLHAMTAQWGTLQEIKDKCNLSYPYPQLIINSVLFFCKLIALSRINYNREDSTGKNEYRFMTANMMANM